MRILIVGGDGMLGHQLLLHLQNKHEVKVTLRQDLPVYKNYGLFSRENSYAGIDVRNMADLTAVMADFRPEAVVNAVGVIKQRAAAKEVIPSLEINSLFPHRLALLCKAASSRMIHLSTDCVFSGKKGNYSESDRSDAEDIYGQSKYLGEVVDAHCVTLRTSIIGLELSRKTALIEWFLAQRGHIKGFTRAIYTGLTTLEMSRLIEKILLRHPELSGVFHVSSMPINKYDLLNLFAKLLHRDDVQILPDDNFFCDRSLLCENFRQLTGYQAPSWQEMLSELVTQVQTRESEILCY